MEDGLSGLCQIKKTINPDCVQGDDTTMDDRMNIKTRGFLNGIDSRNWTTTTIEQVVKIIFELE